MIINSMADASSSKDDITFSFRSIAYKVSTSQGVLSGEVDAEAYKNIDVSSLGSGPYKVQLGYVNNSYRADPIDVVSSDALVTFWMAFPYGPSYPSNGPITYVKEFQK